jgi:AraC-like DNA-binding protein
VVQIPRPSETTALYVPHGRDRLLRRVIERIQQDPGTEATVEDMARIAHTSPRTSARLFVAEIGMTFGRWLEHLRVVREIDKLTRWQSITRTALEPGYRSPSSVTTTLSRVLGMSPGRYLKGGRIAPPSLEFE